MTNCVDIRKQASENIDVSRDRRKGRSDAPKLSPRETRIPVKTNIVTEIESIGPKTAQAYLAKAAKNRRIRKTVVDRYAHAMSQDAWDLTHQGIAFDENGQLVDGQHRLSAVIQSGKTVKMQVSRYVCTAPVAIMDSGASRTQADRAQISGIIPEHARVIVPMLNYMVCAETGVNQEKTLQSHELENLYEQEKQTIAFVLSAFGAAPTRQWPAVIRAAFAYCAVIAPESVANLAYSVRDKVGYKKGSAAHAFAMALSDRKFQLQSCGQRMDTLAKCLWLIRQHIEGKPVERMKASASIFNWAARQRQEKNRLLMPLLK